MWTNNAIDVLNNPNKIIQIIEITQKKPEYQKQPPEVFSKKRCS